MSVLKIKNTPNGAWQPIASIKGAKGDKGDTGGDAAYKNKRCVGCAK